MTALAGLVGAAGAIGHLGAAWVSAIPGDYDPSSGHGPDWGKAAPAGILVWLFLGVCLFFLIKSMNKHIKRVARRAADGEGAAGSQHSPDDGSETGDPAGAGESAGPDAAGTGGTGGGDSAGPSDDAPVSDDACASDDASPNDASASNDEAGVSDTAGSGSRPGR